MGWPSVTMTTLAMRRTAPPWWPSVMTTIRAMRRTNVVPVSSATKAGTRVFELLSLIQFDTTLFKIVLCG